MVSCQTLHSALYGFGLSLICVICKCYTIWNHCAVHFAEINGGWYVSFFRSFSWQFDNEYNASVCPLPFVNYWRNYHSRSYRLLVLFTSIFSFYISFFFSLYFYLSCASVFVHFAGVWILFSFTLCFLLFASSFCFVFLFRLVLPYLRSSLFSSILFLIPIVIGLCYHLIFWEFFFQFIDNSSIFFSLHIFIQFHSFRLLFTFVHS